MFAVLISGLGLIFGAAVILGGAVEPAYWAACVAGLAVLTLIDQAVGFPQYRKPPTPGLVFGALLCLAGFILLQVVPLPVALLRILSPARAAIVTALDPVTGPVRFASLSNAPGETLRAFSQLAGVLMTFLLVERLLARTEDWKWVVVLPPIAVAFGQGLLGIIQVSTQDPSAGVSGSYANRNHFAGLLEMTLPWAILLAVHAWRSNEDRYKTPARVAMGACSLLGAAAVMLIGIIVSLSRMGFLAALVALLTAGSLFLNRGSRRWTRWLGLAPLVAMIIALFIFLPSDQLIARFAGLATTNDISADDRIRIWKDTLALIHAYPVFGCGAWAFEPSFFQHQTSGTLALVNFAHNDYLQGMAELGALGFLFVLVAVVAALSSALEGSLGPRGMLERHLSIAAAASLMAIAFHSIVDFNLYVPANAMLVGWTLALATCGRDPYDRRYFGSMTFELFRMLPARRHQKRRAEQLSRRSAA